MTPETNHDVEISIYYDYLEDQGIIVDRDPEEQDQWIYEYKPYTVGGDGVGDSSDGCGGGFIGVMVGIGGLGGYGVGVGGFGFVGVGGFGGSVISDISERVGG